MDQYGLLSTLTLRRSSGAAKVLERLMDSTYSAVKAGSESATATEEQVDSLLLFTILTIERNWIYPVDVTDFDAARLGYPGEFFLRILDLIVRLENSGGMPARAEVRHPATPDELSKHCPSCG